MERKVKTQPQAQELTHSARIARRFVIMVIALAVLLCWGLLLNVNSGSVQIPAGDVFRMVFKAIGYRIANLFTGGKYADALEAVISGDGNSKIIFSIRIPRMLMAAILGGALAVAGFLIQTFFRNPIAGPFVLGISSGAKLLVGLVMIFGAGVGLKVTSLHMILAAFVGSLAIVGVILLFSQRVNNMSMLLVIGIMMGYICTAVTDFAITFADEANIVSLHNWSKGSFIGASWSGVETAFWICLCGMILAWLLSKPIGAYALGEGYAQSIGINIKLFRAILIVLSSFLSACVTAFAGPISFVGIAVPHITRSLLKTSKPILVIPVAYLCGSVFCVYCDLIARIAFSPREMAISTVTSVFGAPVVIYMMLKRRKAGQ